LLPVVTGGRGNAAVVAGTKIVNEATATYQNSVGAAYGSSSNVITLVVADVASFKLGPQDLSCTQPSDNVSLGGRFSRVFVATNTSNGPDAYQITAASASAGRIAALAFVTQNGTAVPASVNGASSSVVSPGGTVSIAVTVDATGVAAGTRIIVSLSAQTTAATINGRLSASAEQCGLVISPPMLSGTSGARAVIVKTVNGVSAIQATVGAPVTYEIKFQNAGGSAATSVVVTDPVPLGIVPNAASVVIDGVASPRAASLAGNTLSIAIGTVPIGGVVDVTFTGTVSSAAKTGSSLINSAAVGADGIAPVKTAPATVFVGYANVVYDGDVGASAPIAGAVVSVLAPTASKIASDVTSASTTATGPTGTYDFKLPVPKTTTSYVVTVTAAGYVSRRLTLKLVPDATETLYTATLTSDDGAPLAVAGAFSLATGPVSIDEIYGFFGNIPMFRPQSITVSKAVDRAAASGGSRLVYTLTVTNTTTPFGATTVEDDLPPTVAYADHTARVDGLAVEPVVHGARLIWTFPTLTKEHTIVFAAVVLPNAGEGATLVNEMTARASIVGSPGFYATGHAQAQTIVTAGIFSNRIPITGRVYLDDAHAGRFERGDVGVPGVRVWLEDGESVLTDPNGRFDFPATRPGMHVLHLDRETLPKTAAFFATHAYNDERSSVRLVHGPFDGGLLQDVNFALQRVTTSP
jgi:uncharacterized repeat protein (TIGR01451 family)